MADAQPRRRAFVSSFGVGDAEKVLDEVVRRVAPGVSVPLPRTWDGSMETGDTKAYADRTVAAFADVPVPGPLDD